MHHVLGDSRPFSAWRKTCTNSVAPDRPGCRLGYIALHEMTPEFKRGTPALHLNESTWIIDGFNELIVDFLFALVIFLDST